MRAIALVNLLLFFLIISCNNKPNDKFSIITERIQYDVDIKSPDSDFDWWVQNLEGSDREKLVNLLLTSAYEGKVNVYGYYSNELLSVDEVKKIGFKSDTLTFQRSGPPYELYDTIVERKVDYRDITRIRFLEGWYINEKTLEFKKEVIGIAPLLKSYDPDGNFRGYMPMFWVYADEP
jgi:hypothetical protein